MKKILLILTILLGALFVQSQTTITDGGNVIILSGSGGETNINKSGIVLQWLGGDRISFLNGTKRYDVNYSNITTPSFSTIDSLIDWISTIAVNQTFLGDKEWFQRVAEDELTDYDSEFKFGENISVGTTEEVIWDGGGTYTFLSAAETMHVFSDDTADNIYGTGARLIIVVGLNQYWQQTSQFIVPIGTDTVTTDTSFLRVFRSIVILSGDPSPIGDANVGDITIQGSSTSTLQAKILANNGQTLMAVYTVPRGKTAYATGISLGVGQGKECVFKAKFRNGVGGAFSIKYSLTLYQQALNLPLKTALRVPEKIDMVITGITATGTVKANASFGLILKDD